MSQQGPLHPRSSNGFGRKKLDREMGNSLDNKLQAAKFRTNSFGVTDVANENKVGGYESPSRDRILFLTTSLIGQTVEVQVKNGSIFTGVFHATSAEKEIGIVLKMARLTKDAFLKGQKPLSDFANKPSSKTMIIPSKELVQVIAKDVPLTANGVVNGHAHEKQQDIMIDSLISQSHHVEVERKLEPWVPDESIPQYPELENIFQNTWNRNWDQFEANEALFGVKSTFDEEIYTTKLDKGPQMKELEKEALRIAREIEGEQTQDIHLAEERGVNFPEGFELDEESRFSSVYRVVDDGVYEENDGALLDACNDETFGPSSKSNNESFVCERGNSTPCFTKSDDVTQASSGPSSQPESSVPFPSDKGIHLSCSISHSGEPLPKSVFSAAATEGAIRVAENQTNGQPFEKSLFKEFTGRNFAYEVSQPLKLEDSAATGKVNLFVQAGNDQAKPGCSTASTSDSLASASLSSGPTLSPSSSVGSLASEKSTLNPHAKEFKLNPNAKSFTPSLTPLRPQAPFESSFYLSANVSTVPHVHGASMGLGVTPSFGGHQPLVYNPQAASMPAPQGYYTNGPMYGQQMFMGQPRQFLYMPAYSPELQFKGREY
ncbi:polyadenylate-binding protein-interacting protein 3-like isoform X2 [Nymphaea colorata]|uniref:polyadenylate-binding protein-interacting protein 3-like isoform X2 n=1 Tax=Nymphaea colorata TaxID=210225 RepID=UPI00129D25DB|nr:polyadenylate-binding protein-interacting protein 3-like isoform X2 [Nymphaea colorata]